jgi:hypothetical protein
MVSPEFCCQQEIAAQMAGISQLLLHRQRLHQKLVENQAQLMNLRVSVSGLRADIEKVLPVHAPLTLQASLESVARLGYGYLLASGSEIWTARELLFCFQTMQPLSLKISVALVLPDAISDGAIYEVGEDRTTITDAPLFSIERPRPPGRHLRDPWRVA